MTLTLSDSTTGTTLELYNAQTVGNERQAEVNVSPPTGFDSEVAFLTSLAQDGRITIQGAVTANRLTGVAGFSSDPLTALAEWAVTLESFVNGAPGNGYTLQQGYRGESTIGILSDIEWVARAGETYELGYSLQFVQGQGAGVTAAITTDDVTPGGDFVIDGTTVPTFDEFGVRKSQPVETFRRTFAEDPDDNDILTNAGATREVRLTGNIAREPTQRAAFDGAITQTLGQDTLVDFRDAVTGRTYTGILRAYDATDTAGTTRLGEYAVEFVEGRL